MCIPTQSPQQMEVLKFYEVEEPRPPPIVVSTTPAAITSTAAVTTVNEEETPETTVEIESEEVASTTVAVEDMCANCDFDEIDVTITGPNVITFIDDDPPTAEGCKVTYFFCGRSDGALCTTVELRATNPSSFMLLTGDITSNSIALSFTCGDDGRYLYGSFTGITALSCVITGCTGSVCEDCDIDAIKPVSTDPMVYVYTEEQTPTADGCKVTLLNCGRTDSAMCTTVLMTATNPTSSTMISDDTTFNTVSVTLTCGKDGQYTHGSFTGITQITCDISGCTSGGGK
ncbi:hypothetical protein CAEBREN_06031 [Caenorhabditis brenneri]|uniref:DUF281 domain-containing protein n=1 Tax=Caenorhabditis brenneri TaxID=135651 RepID=G0MCW2_CAEBE|nr:hypothetical protein CAEBREN_06031 [Caenorhabditis brenneri]